tara:strand:- start:316 stop:540 length:225 start_codon:yes stop_codon:yes gene_type:complete
LDATLRHRYIGNSAFFGFRTFSKGGMSYGYEVAPYVKAKAYMQPDNKLVEGLNKQIITKKLTGITMGQKKAMDG